MAAKDLLLVCWDFPPNHGIGGRRWAKFAKSLARKEYNIHVIKSSPLKGNKPSAWTRDVSDKKIKIYEIETYWAVKWLHNYTSALSSLKIRIAQIWLRLKVKGTIFDKAAGVENEFLNLATKVIRENNIKNVIVTGAPFNLLCYAARLKSGIPDLNLIGDYRDPWLNSVNYGINFLNDKRRKEEEEKQDLVFQQFNYISSPNAFLNGQIKRSQKKSSVSRVKFIELPHSYDPDDVQNNPVTRSGEKIFRIVYAGALYTDSAKYFGELINALSLLKRQQNITIHLDVFSEHDSPVEIPAGIKDQVRFQKPIGDKIFSIIRNYDLMLILLTWHNKDFKTTKFFEFLPYKIPYLYVGPEGFVSESIEKDKLGYVLKEPADLLPIFSGIRNENMKVEGFNNIESYSLEKVSEILIGCLSN